MTRRALSTVYLSYPLFPCPSPPPLPLPLPPSPSYPLPLPLPLKDAHSLSCTPSLQNLDLKSFAETEDSTTPHSSTLSSRHSRMRHFSDLSFPVVGESVSLLEEAQQQQRQQHGGREGVSGGNKTSRDTEMYQNILVREVGASQLPEACRIYSSPV